ncbi:MAG: hypothetical protein A3A86_08360 [Elusimicrobia bacterium RIFCSPLOWO2_01_FULL_60_11]|nr:MAG: hypothetical protein A3A86_08360 [Elusimicrobia bacterium RIFCSPLOWO2_01_FULL_60_11]
MFEAEAVERGFYETLLALEPILEKVLVVGGWCPYLYAKHLWKIPIENLPRTTDIDLGIWDTGSIRYNPTVYSRLLSAGYGTAPYDEDEPEKIEFVWNKGDENIKIEFITSWFVSDDTLQRFLGPEMACHRIDAFEILLQSKPILLKVPIGSKELSVRSPSPGIYLFHKGITFAARSGEVKKNKDLLYVYYMLRYARNVRELLADMEPYRGKEEFKLFSSQMREFFGREGAEGYDALMPLLVQWLPPERARSSIRSVFAPLLEFIRK